MTLHVQGCSKHSQPREASHVTGCFFGRDKLRGARLAGHVDVCANRSGLLCRSHEFLNQLHKEAPTISSGWGCVEEIPAKLMFCSMSISAHPAPQAGLLGLLRSLHCARRPSNIRLASSKGHSLPRWHAFRSLGCLVLCVFRRGAAKSHVFDCHTKGWKVSLIFRGYQSFHSTYRLAGFGMAFYDGKVKQWGQPQTRDNHMLST